VCIAGIILKGQIPGNINITITDKVLLIVTCGSIVRRQNDPGQDFSSKKIV